MAVLDVRLTLRLVRRPMWLLGVAAMILGFVVHLTALRFGRLALVQPILATELLFVFAYMAVLAKGSLKRRDWLRGGPWPPDWAGSSSPRYIQEASSTPPAASGGWPV